VFIDFLFQPGTGFTGLLVVGSNIIEGGKAPEGDIFCKSVQELARGE
jgi:hypothetical protein